MLPEIMRASYRFVGFLLVTMVLSTRVFSGVIITSMRLLFASSKLRGSKCFRIPEYSLKIIPNSDLFVVSYSSVCVSVDFSELAVCESRVEKL